MPLQVLLVDDHPAIHDALACVVADVPDMVVCGCAASAEEAFALIQASSPDVAVVDLILAQSHGMDLIKQIVQEAPGVQVVVYSLLDEKVYAERVLKAGALAYLMKTEPTSEVIEAIQSAAREEVYLSRKMQRRLLNNLAHRQGQNGGLSLDKLTDREVTIFHLLGQGFTVPSISENLHLNRKTVEAYRRRIKSKLGFDTVNELLRFAIRYSLEQM